MTPDKKPDLKDREYESRLFPPHMFPGLTPQDIKRGLWIMLGMSIMPFVLLITFGKQQDDSHKQEHTFEGVVNVEPFREELNRVSGTACHVLQRKGGIQDFTPVNKLGDCFAAAYRLYKQENPKGENIGFGIIGRDRDDVIAEGYCGREYKGHPEQCYVTTATERFRLKLE